MLGLNLNTSIPFSPVTEITYHALTPEEEVDAVTGKEDKMSHDLLALFMLHQENEKKNPANYQFAYWGYDLFSL